VWGDGGTRSNVAPTPVSGLRDVLQLDAGGLLVCAVLAGGRVTCWGGDTGASASPAPAASSAPGGDADTVSVAAAHACARMRAGTVRCWGDSPWNGAGGPMVDPRIREARQVTTGDAMVCVREGPAGVSCWGRNDQGELGQAPDNDWHAQPSRVAIPTLCPGTKPGEVIDVSAGESHVCAVVSGGGCVWCWGSNGDGELGRGSQGQPEGPGLVGGGLRGIDELALGADHVCARGAAAGDDHGGIWCWGSNAQGQLGDGTTERHPTPVHVAW
jgi:hypothetical protein